MKLEVENQDIEKMRKIRRRCECGCGGITNYGRKWVQSHHMFGNTNSKERKLSKKHKKNLSLALKGRKHSEETKKKMSLAHIGNKSSEKTKLKLSVIRTKYDPNYKYCDIWKDKEYRKDIRKDYCENRECKKISNFLINHHIDLDKKHCSPKNIMTLCRSCHTIWHAKLQEGKIPANPKDYIIINRLDHISYIHKKSREVIRMERALL